MAEPNIEVNLRAADVPTLAANYFHFTRVAEQFEFVVGYLSLRDVHEAVERSKRDDSDEPGGHVLDAEVVSRFSLSISGIRLLHNRTREILENMDAQVAGESKEDA